MTAYGGLLRFWRAYPAFKGLKMGFSEVASPSTFETDPYLAWGFYGHRLNLYRVTVPHEGFELMRQWAREMRGGCWVFTSNIDGQFERAGFDPDFIEECHGSIHRVQCLEDCADELWLADAIYPQVNMETCRWQGDLPDCPNCGGLARPNVLMFGDYAWNDRVRERQRARRLEWMSELKAARYRPVVLELGAGVAIPTAREFAAYARRQFDEVGARLIRVNPRQADVTGGVGVEVDPLPWTCIGLILKPFRVLSGHARRHLQQHQTALRCSFQSSGVRGSPDRCAGAGGCTSLQSR